MSERVKMLVLHMDHCTQCIRMSRDLGPDGEYRMRCHGNLFQPRELTEAENAAIRQGTMRIPVWCPLPDAEEPRT